jgi:succinate dehydrogenase/fumarate reductase flavoprotein subunit
MTQPDEVIDLLVLGAGMAGLGAAAKAASEGASVVVVEKGEAIGGSAAYAGFIWTAPTTEVMREVNPDGDPVLGQRIVDGYQQALSFVRSLGTHVADPVTVLGYGRGSQTDMANFLLACDRIVRERGEVLVRSQATSLLTEDGAVVGAKLQTPAGERTIRARHTLLATGGFGGDPGLRAELIGPAARDIPLRANPHSAGDGLRLAASAGAATGTPNAGFYGHLIPSNVVYENPYEFTDLTFYHSEHGVLINRAGQRFCDETIGDHLSTLHVLDQPEARALLITDQRVHDQWMLAPYVEGVEPLDKFQLAYKRGARAAIAEDLEELAYLPEEWGYDGDAALATMLEFNGGTRTHGRRLDDAPLVDPPYYVIEVIPAITFTFTGVRIDAQARVLDGDGQPIHGLLAAGADAGGVFHRAYAGGLAAALVFGLQAAATATSARLTN